MIKIPAEEWAEKYSQNAHKAVFNEIKPGFRDRISYALLVVKDEIATGYVTVREMDDENVYWQFGGVLPTFRKSMTAVCSIEAALAWQKLVSRRVVTYVENTNSAMLRFYIKYGFLIIGTRTFNGKIMVDLIKDLQDGDAKYVRSDVNPTSSPTGELPPN